MTTAASVSLLKKAPLVYKSLSYLLVIFSFFLPLYEQANTWILIALVLCSIYVVYQENLGRFIKQNGMLLFIPSLLLLIRIIEIFNSDEISTGIKESTRALSFLFLPFCFLVFSRIPGNWVKQNIFWSLTAGCFVAAVICWSNVLWIIWENNEPITNLFTWKKSNAYLTKAIDIHPPYLGALVLIVIIYLFYEYVHLFKSKKKRIIAILLIALFLVFLFHLVVRNSLLYLVLITFGYMLYFKKWKALILAILCLSGLTFTVINNGNHYLKRKYYKMLDFSDEKIGDKRFQRLEASYQVFSNHPLFGAGMGKVDEERLAIYKKMKDKRAVEMNFNSHNQYMEYLCTFGIFGLLVFVGVLFWLLRRAFIYREYFLVILLGLCMFACITESFLERELGIKLFSLITALIIYRTCIQQTQRRSI